MTIEVKNFHECPFVDTEHNGDNYCSRTNSYLWEMIKSIPINCPLKTEPITVKIKEDEK